MLTEFLMVAILVYLQFTDRYAGIWSMSAAIISLIGETIWPNIFEAFFMSSNIFFLKLDILTTAIHSECIFHQSDLTTPKLFFYPSLSHYARRLHSLLVLFKCTWMESKFRPSSFSNYYSNCSRCFYNMELYKEFPRHWTGFEQNMPVGHNITEHIIFVAFVSHVTEKLLVDKHETYGHAGTKRTRWQRKFWPWGEIDMAYVLGCSDLWLVTVRWILYDDWGCIRSLLVHT